MATAITIQQSVHPLLITCFVIGSGTYPMDEPRSLFGVLYCLTLWCIYGCIYCYMLIHVKKIIFRRSLTTIVYGTSVLTAIISVIVGLCYNKKWRMFIKKLADVDDTLEELGTCNIYKEMHVWSRRLVIGWIVFVLSINIFDTFWWLETRHNNWAYLIPHIINYTFHNTLYSDLMFIFFMWYLGNRLDKVKEHARNLLAREELGLRSTWKRPVILVYRYNLYTDNRRVLWTLMHLYLEICRIARELNLMFGLQMILEMVTQLLYLTMVIYYWCVIILSPRRTPIEAWIGNTTWGILCFIRFYFVNYVCEIISVKAKKTNEVIYQLTDILRYADMHNEICQITLHAIHHPLKFTGLGFFYFGTKLLWQSSAVIIMLAILTVQWSPELQEYNLRSKLNNDTDVSYRRV